jgi:DNA-binding transcriptional MerR regulator
MKRYFIGDIADRLKLNPRTIRYYERIGILPNPGRTESGYRVYTEKTIERLQFILKLDEIKEILLLYDKGQVPCDCTRTIINNKIIEIEDKIAALTSLKSQLQKSIQVQRGKSLSESICPIIMGSEKNS